MIEIAHIHTDLPEKFGLPRQSGVAPSLTGRIVFEPEYRDANALRGIEDFSHLWLIWKFSKAVRERWSPTVRPPRLGGNEAMGVFATRSPFRPNPIGLSSVKLIRVEWHTPDGPVLVVGGVDLMDGTPIYDIKPYLAYADSHPDAVGGFTDALRWQALDVVIPEKSAAALPPEKLQALRELLAQDPRPGYRRSDERAFGLTFAGHNVRFCVRDGVLTVLEILPETE